MSQKILVALRPLPHPTLSSCALLAVRLIAGIAFMQHGWGKIQSPLNWMGPDATVPAIFQFLAALSEFGGGLAWVLGLLTPLASLGIGFTMAVAVHMHMIVRQDPFVSATGGSSYELALGYLGLALLFLSIGPGRYSLDRVFFKERS